MRHFISGLELGYDTETTGTRVEAGAKPFMFTFSNGDGETAVAEFWVDPFTREVDYSRPVTPPGMRPITFDQVRAVLEDSRVTKTSWNLKFDRRMSKAAGITLAGPCHDGMIAAKVCKSDEPTYELKAISKRYGRFKNDDEKRLQSVVNSLRNRAKKLGWKVAPEGEGKSDYWLVQHAERIMKESLRTLKTWQTATQRRRIRMENKAAAEAEKMLSACRDYGGLDAERAIFMWCFYKDILETEGLWDVYQEEMDLMPVVEAMEDRGVKLSRVWVDKGQKYTAELIESTRKSIDRHAWPGFNPNSYPQKLELFIERLGLEPLGLTKGGGPKLDRAFYEHYADVSPACSAIVEHDRANKAKGTYFDNYKLFADEDGVVHCNFDQIGAKTLRFSCRGPNFQNVPKRGRCKRCRKEMQIAELRGFHVRCKACGEWQPLDPLIAVRRPFRPRPGYVWLLNDYKQIEARIFADEAEEEVLLNAFKAGRDPYEELAAAVLEQTGLDIGRDIAKHIFLGKIYGLGVGKMVITIQSMGGGRIDAADAKALIDAFNETFPNSVEYMRQVQRDVKRDGFVVNRYGQRIDVDQDMPYRGVNYKIQSAAARLMKRAMMKTHRFLREHDLGYLVMTIHDELIFEVPDDCNVRSTARQLAALMEDNEGMFTVATPVDVSCVKKTWLIKEELEFNNATR